MSITLARSLKRAFERMPKPKASGSKHLLRLVRSDQEDIEQLETLALEGLNSGEPPQAGPGYWEEKHGRLDARLQTSSR